MRMAELSERSGVPAPTIRYYIREGLVPRGTATSPNQAVYDAEHVAALRLARALVEVGGLGIPQARAVLEHLGRGEKGRFAALGSVQYALTPAPPVPRGPGTDRVDALLAARGWRVRPDNPARAVLAAALEDLERIGVPIDDALLDTWADGAGASAAGEIGRVTDPGIPDAALAVVGLDVLGDRAISALRRLAQEHELGEHGATDTVADEG